MMGLQLRDLDGGMDMTSTCGGDSGKLVLQEDDITRKLQRTLDVILT